MTAGDCPVPASLEALETLAASPLFTGVGRAALREMAPSFVRESWPKGREIGNPKDFTHQFRLIAHGRVKITRTNPEDAREVTLWLLGRGDGFDIVSLLDGEPHDVAACALDDIETFAVALPVFERWIEQSEPLRLALHRYIAQQLRAITDLAGDLALHDTMTRLARLLLRHFDNRTPVRGERLNLIRDLPQSELASLVGSVRVVVSRVLAALKRERVVNLRNGKLHVIDLERLVRHAELQARAAGHQSRRQSVT